MVTLVTFKTLKIEKKCLNYITLRIITSNICVNYINECVAENYIYYLLRKIYILVFKNL